ncbi:hypothetical protein LAUMK13_02428 [Mycobacterium innocens]|uniref:Uncharacterized protein n=1 Tax=Mycobacterium innocens TaxID=2341083 RepID=A0A498Q350_9MYCO|nr:hypothetical protein LAUMK13_02428 [Mycobacterium innocens]
MALPPPADVLRLPRPGKMRIAPRRSGVGNLTHLDQAKRYCLGLA